MPSTKKARLTGRRFLDNSASWHVLMSTIIYDRPSVALRYPCEVMAGPYQGFFGHYIGIAPSCHAEGVQVELLLIWRHQVAGAGWSKVSQEVQKVGLLRENIGLLDRCLLSERYFQNLLRDQRKGVAA